MGTKLPLWGGVECTVNRVGDRFIDQWKRSRHHERPCDLQRLADLGIEAARHAVLWERVCPDTPDEADWKHADASLARLREIGVDPIVGLLHHGSGPAYTSLDDPEFPEKLARFARMAAERYPWVAKYTPVNEPLTTARFSGLYGLWYPHGRDAGTFAKCLLNELKGTVLAMREIRKVNPNAQLVQTEDLGKTHCTAQLLEQAEFENERRWITWDLLGGRFDRDGIVGKWLRRAGITVEELDWFAANPCPPDILGVNYYVTSERFLDHRLDRYPECTHGGNGRMRYADVEAVRVLVGGQEGPKGLLLETAHRFRSPIAITECHLGCTREEQMRWVKYVYEQAQAARSEGADIRAVTVWSLFGAFDWNSLLCREAGHYEPGVFDLRAPSPRATGIAHVVKTLASQEKPDHPLLQGPGWWERPIRLLYPPVIAGGRDRYEVAAPSAHESEEIAPLLLVGAHGRLGRSIAEACEVRGIRCVAVDRDELDAARGQEIASVLDRHRPWAVVNAAGLPSASRCDKDPAACFRANLLVPMMLSRACAAAGVRMLTFSSPDVFDGRKGAPYVESDPCRAVSTLGESKVEAERRVLDLLPDSLVVRSGPLFGGVGRSEPLVAPGSLISPTYVPDLVTAALDLFIDGESGIWHLANRGAVHGRSWLRATITGQLESAQEPAVATSFVLESERGWIMPTLEDAFARWIQSRTESGVEEKQAYVA